MFKLALSPQFWATVKVEYTDENGRKMPGSFGVQFKRMPMDDVQAKRREIRDMSESGEIMSGGDPEFLRDLVTGFKDIEVPAEFNEGTAITAEETRPMLDYLSRAGFASAMVLAFFAEYPKARTKN